VKNRSVDNKVRKLFMPFTLATSYLDSPSLLKARDFPKYSLFVANEILRGLSALLLLDVLDLHFRSWWHAWSDFGKSQGKMVRGGGNAGAFS